MSESTQPQPNLREQRGLAIAKNCSITQENDKKWVVPSQNNPNIYYFVKSNGFGAKCNCPDYKKNDSKCKHIFAVEYIVTQEINEKGEVVDEKVEKKTYTQNWSQYDKSQKEEKDRFMFLLNDLVKNIEKQEENFGRPKAEIRDLVYSMIFKVYSGVSSRRYASEMNLSKTLEYIEKEVPFTTMKDYFNKEEVMPILQELIKLSSQPLKEIENDFAIDSSGFGTSVKQNWNEFKHIRNNRHTKWVKCHIVSGVKTNTIPAVKITSEFEHDSPQLKELVSKTSESFNINEFSGDKAYMSKDNLEAITSINATPYIPFKKNVKVNSTHKNGMVWKRTLHYFLFNQEEFMQHYHKRSNVETSFHMIKSKFGSNVRAKNWTAQVNEVLCKVICHNICVLIKEMDKLGIESNLLIK